jgi:hypothetical protein
MTARILACGLVLAGVALSACGGSGSGSTPSPSATGSPTPATAIVDSPLKPLVITAAQATQVDPIDSARLVDAGSTTLKAPVGTTIDICGDSFPSEALRTERLQVGFEDPQGHPNESNEVVRYQSAAAATQAYNEVKAAAASCTKPWSLSQVQAEPVDPSLLPQQVALSGQQQQTRIGGVPIYACFIWQFRNDLLSAIYAFRGERAQACQVARGLAGIAKSNLESAS